MGKTVYILGAGFSMDAGAPPQSKIIENIFRLRNIEFPNKKNVLNWIKTFEEFLSIGLNIPKENHQLIDLEDVFTPIDRALLESLSVGNYSNNKLNEIRNTINKLIILAIRYSIKKKGSNSKYIEDFAKYIIQLADCKKKSESNDQVAIITTNWDVLLDNKIHAKLTDKVPKTGEPYKGVVDYCCYISSLEEHDHQVKPGLYAIAKNRFNVKILKLHGSFNWLQCPKCSRLYVKFYSNFDGGYVINKKYCRHCDTNFNSVKIEAHQLYVNLITPTFLKNFNNIQNKLIWQNSGIELSEADRIVFIGYSLPMADFEFKQLLSRMLRKDVKIEVVLRQGDDHNSTDQEFLKPSFASYRYEKFFVGKQITFHFEGVQKYISNFCKL